MFRARPIPALLALLVLSACETTGGPRPPGPPRPPREAPPSADVFRPSDFSWSAVPGKNRIEGRLAYSRPGARYTCSGAGVILTPETLWTRRRMVQLYNSPSAAALPVEEVRARTPKTNDDYSAFLKRTTCDSYDRFSFAGLPDGAWFAITLARPAAGAKGPNIAIMRRVETRRGRAVTLEL